MTDHRPTTSPELAPQLRELTLDELERVDGGGGANFLLGDGSIRFVGTTDYKWLTHLDRTL